MPPRGGHGGGGHHGGGGRHGGHHHGHHGGGGFWGGGPVWSGYPYPASELVVVAPEESEEAILARKLRELEMLERIRKLQGKKPLKGMGAFDLPTSNTFLIGAVAIGIAYFLLKKKRRS